MEASQSCRMKLMPVPVPSQTRSYPRELEVLTLLAHGLSNDQIASYLVISDATAKTDAAHVLMKLDLADRVDAVMYAYESRPIQPGRGP